MSEEWRLRLSDLLSEALNLEHAAFYYYLSAGARCDSKSLSLLNLKSFFYDESKDELKHAKMVIEYMNRIGLKIVFKSITTPDITQCSVEELFELAVKHEEKVLNHYLIIKKEADEVGDHVTGEFLDWFVEKQVKEIKDFTTLHVNSKRCKDPLGLFMFDESFKKRK